MNRNCLFALVILLVFVNGSDAAVLGQFRRLVGLKPPEDHGNKPEISPSPAPILPETGSDLNNTKNVNSNDISTGKNNTQIPPIPSNSTNGDSNDTTKKKKNEEGIDDKCESSSSTNRCTNDKDMIACLHLQHPQNQQTA